MKEIVKVKLENEMDLILAHKRAMKLCDLCGLSIIVQTSFATAVSEIARCAIEFGKKSTLLLGINSLPVNSMQNRAILKAIIQDNTDLSQKTIEAASYARRLVDEVSFEKTAREFQIVLKQNLNLSAFITDAKIQTFIEYFKMEPPLSAYDELRRKNALLQDLAEKLRESESDYKILTDSLPLMMFSASYRNVITYTNKWLRDFLGAAPKELTSAAWQDFLEPTDYPLFVKDLNNALLRQVTLTGQYRFKEMNENFVWHMITIMPLKNDKDVIQQWIGLLVDINAQKLIERALKDNKELHQIQDALYNNQKELQQKVIELNRSNYELEQFAHLATHDLQEPLRKLFFTSDVLKNKYSKIIDPAGLAMFDSMTRSATRMKELINDLLSYSQLQQQKMIFESVDLNRVIAEIIKELDVAVREKKAKFDISALPVISGNRLRLYQLFSNLISNSLKYSRQEVAPFITIRVAYNDAEIMITVKDNGIGFEEIYNEKIFGLFERLHTRSQFPGTGIGLSICRRITELHNGKISARSVPGESSTFEIVLPMARLESIERKAI